MTMSMDAQRATVMPSLYRALMRATKKHGMRTLSKINRRLYPAGQVIRLRTGADFFVPPDPHFFGYVIGHEEHIARLIEEEVEEGDTCIDVGANIGYFSAMMAARCGESGRVLAYEPEAGNFAALSENARIARGRGLTIEPACAAVSDRKGTLELVRGEESTLHEVRPAGAETPADRLIPCVSLEEDLRGRGIDGPIKLVKIDVEGHEAAVVGACIPLFMSGRVRAVVIEVTAGDEACVIARLIEQMGATPRCWLDGAWADIPVAEIPRRTDVLLRFAP